MLDRPRITSAVSLYSENGKWWVAVREQVHQHPPVEFGTRAFGFSYAYGQRIRLGLDRIEYTKPAGPA